MNKLCCEVNPCYICKPCGFKECEDHWRQTQMEGTYHFSKGDLDYCPVADVAVEPYGVKPQPTIWKKKRKKRKVK